MATIKGGDKLERALAKIVASLATGGTLRVGFLENATYPDGTPVAMIAAIQDFGAPKPRPFFRNMVAKKSPGWPRALATILKSNGYNADKALQLMGVGIGDQLRASIHETNSPPLAPSTVARKGFDKPLIESSHMLNSVDFEVVK